MTQTEALKNEINLVLTDPDTNLSHGARRALDYVFGQLEALAQTQEPKIKTIDPFESSRVADYNRGWNDCLFASGIVKQTEQEPVDFDAIIADIEAISCRYQGDPSHDHCPYKIRSESADTVRRHASYYTTPPQRKPLTDEKIEELANEYLFAEEDLEMLFVGGSVEFARAIEAAHGIKEHT